MHVPERRSYTVFRRCRYPPPETLTDGESGIQSEGKRGSGPNELSPPSIRIPSGLFPRLKRSLEEGIAVALDALTKMLVGELFNFLLRFNSK